VQPRPPFSLYGEFIRCSAYSPGVATADDVLSAEFLELARRQRETLRKRIDLTNAKVEELRAEVNALERHAAGDAVLLREIEDVLDLAPQLRVDLQTEELRGQRLRDVAVEILRAEVGAETPIHYRDWFRLVRDAGHRIAGANPLAAFLTVVSRSEEVERMGTRSGMYQLRAA